MKQRFWTGAAMVIILAPLYTLGGWFSTILVMAIAYIGTYELINMYQTKNPIPKVCKFIIPVFSLLIVLVGGTETAYYLIYLLVLEFIGLLVLSIFAKNITFKDCIFFMFANIYSGITFAIIESLRNLDKLAFRADSSYYYVTNWFGSLNIKPVGFILFTFVLITAMATDIGAYSIGRKFGKHKLCPQISPKKTVEGAVGGAIIGSLMGTIYMTILNYVLEPSKALEIRMFNIENDALYIVTILVVAIIVSIASELGDLVASKLKREYEIKDFGNILPGHGGILDRFDSTILSGLVFFVILIFVGAI
jgi:cytidylyltransferase family